MTTERPWREESRLRQLYVEDQRTQIEVADELGCSEATVRKWLERFEIEREAPSWTNEATLRKLREKHLSQAEIADVLGCEQSTIANWMNEFGMDTSRVLKPQPWRDEEVLRRLYVQQGLTMDEVAATLDCSRQAVEEWIHRYDIPTRSRNPDPPTELTQEAVLRRLYVDEGLSTYAIAEKAGCVPSAVHAWLDRHDIETRSVGSQPGKLHHRWKGGAEPYYGKNWHERRRTTLRRDGHECSRCGQTDEDHRKQYEIGLDVHHITPRRCFDDARDANTLDNLVTLCRKCHNYVEGKEVDFENHE